MQHIHRTWRVHQMDNTLDTALLIMRGKWPTDTAFQLGCYVLVHDGETAGDNVYAILLLRADGLSFEVERVDADLLDITDLIDLLEATILNEFDQATWVERLPDFRLQDRLLALAS